MIKLLELSFVGIGRFTTKQTIDFRDKAKLIQVDGRNNNTKGSSGSGKSTVFHALDYLLGINGIPATSLQTRNSKVGLEAAGLFDIDGVIIRITRSKKDGLSIVYEDGSQPNIIGNVAIAEERLLQIIGIPLDLFRKMVHKKQKEGGFFLKLTSAKTYEFLIKVLGLEQWTIKIKKIEEDIKTNKDTLKKTQLDFDTHQSSKTDIETTIAGMIAPVATVTATDKEVYQAIIDAKTLSIAQIKEEQDLAEKADTALIAQANASRAAIVAPVKSEVVTDTAVIDASNVQITTLEAAKKKYKDDLDKKLIDKRKDLDTANQKIYSIKIAKETIIKVTADIKSIKDQEAHINAATCPTCAQGWVGDGATVQLAKLKTDLATLASKAWNLKSEIDSEPVVAAEVLVIKQAIKDMEDDKTVETIANKVTELKATIKAEEDKNNAAEAASTSAHTLKLVEYNNQLLQVSMGYTEKFEASKKIISDLKLSLQTAEADLKQAHSDLKNIDDKLLDFQTQLTNHAKSTEKLTSTLAEKIIKTNELSAKLIKINQEIAIAEEAKRVIKNYTLEKFQESLDYIGEQATAIVSRIPNMANASIYFENSYETKSGNLKDEVNAIINMDGENDIPIKTLSGGEETSIELAVDLAVIEMIEHKAGKGADFFILDEPFDGLDSINKEECLDLLQTFDTNKKIIIVDHSPELKAMVNEVITVVRDGEESRVA